MKSYPCDNFYFGGSFSSPNMRSSSTEGRGWCSSIYGVVSSIAGFIELPDFTLYSVLVIHFLSKLFD